MNPVPMTNASAASFNFSRLPRVTERPEPELGALVGRVLENRYLTEELLDESSISTRYRAYDMATDEAVTVEVLPRRALRSWPKIRQAVTRLTAHGHPHVANLLGHGILAGSRPFLVFEMPSHRTLKQLQRAEAPLDLRRALRIGIQCAEALAALHDAGVVHGRFSSDHVRVIAEGTARETLEVDGYGLAPLIDEAPRPALAVQPAVEDAATSPRGVATDIQQLGAVLRKLVRPARADAQLATPANDCGSQLLPHRIFDKIIARCFADRARRPYPSAALLCSDLRRLEAALEARGWQERAGAARESPPTSATRARVPATIHTLRARARVASHPALPKVIVSSGA